MAAEPSAPVEGSVDLIVTPPIRGRSRDLGERPAERSLAPGELAQISPEDLTIVHKRQEWRLKVATLCLDYFDGCDKATLVNARHPEARVRGTAERAARLADCARQDLPQLLVTAIAVPELEAVRYQVNYFLEEVIRHVRNEVQRRGGTRNPLESLSDERLRDELRQALERSPEALLLFVEDLLRLEEFELEVRTQRKRIRILLGGDRRLSAFGSNEAIIRADLDEFWQMIDGFLSVSGYINSNLPPLLEEASAYPELDEELKLALKQLKGLAKEKIEPLERTYLAQRALDEPLHELERGLREVAQICFNFKNAELVSLMHSADESPKRPAVLDFAPFSDTLRTLARRLEELHRELEPPARATLEKSRDGVREADAKRLRELLGRIDEAVPRLAEQTIGATVGLLDGVADHERSLDSREAPRLRELVTRLGNQLATAHALFGETAQAIQDLRNRSIRQLREEMCALMGEFRTFLQTGFAHIAAKDPRSTESSYHYFLREFSQEAHQALQLLKEITTLEVYLMGLQRFRVGGLPLTPENLARILRVLFSDQDQKHKRIPSGEGWKMMAAFLANLKAELVPRLQQVCVREGIRYEDKNFLTTWSNELAESCTRCLAQHELGYSLVQELGRLREEPSDESAHQTYQHIVVGRTCREMQRALQSICMTLTAAIPYVGIMKDGIERRASVFFHRQQMLQARRDAGESLEVEATTA